MSAPRIDNWDAVDDELGDCVILADLVWDLATEMGHDGPAKPQDLTRLHAVSKVLKIKLQQLDEAVSLFPLRISGGA